MKRVMVNVHGAGKQMSNFYAEGLKALTRLLGAEPAMRPCWYADLSNIGSAVFGVGEDLPPEADEFRTALRQEIREQKKAVEAGQEAEFGLIDAAAAIAADLVADVTRYVFDPDLASAIQARLHDVLAKASVEADDIVLVSHSLGTVVAFDALHDAASRYKVSKFFTMGSPLLKLVHLRRRSSDLGQISPATVPLWRNLYDTTDPVADAIGPGFPGYPIQDVFIQVADAPVPSHDYWRNPQVLAMLAETMKAQQTTRTA